MEGEITYDTPYMWNSKGNDANEPYLQIKNRLTDLENKHIIAGGRDN